MANQRIILYRNTNAPTVILETPGVDWAGYTAEFVVAPASGAGTTFTSPSGGLTVDTEEKTVTWQQATSYVNTLSQGVSARADLYRVLGSYREKLAAFDVQIGGIGDYFETPTYVIQVPGIAGPKGEKGDKGDKGDTGDITAELEAARDEAVAAATQAALYDGVWLDDVAAVLADTSLTYTGGSPSSVTAGNYVRLRKNGFSYQVAASDASDQHITTAGGVKLYVEAETEGYDIRAFGADPTGVTDSTASIQKAIDAASANKVGNVWIVGVFLCNDRLVMKRGANLRGNWHQSTSAANFISRINFVNTSGVEKRACLVLDRAEDPNVSFVEWTGIHFAVSTGGGGWESFIYNKEVHWHRVRNCYFSGSVSGAVVWWGAVLYPLIEYCIFSIQAGQVFFDGRETNYDITYYGVNWGTIQNNSIFGPCDVFWGNGLITIKNNNIENGDPGKAIFVARIYGPSSTNMTIVENYVEWGGGEYGHGFVTCESGGQGYVSSRDNYAQFGGQSTAINANGNALSIDSDRDYFGSVGTMIGLPSSAASVNMGRNRALGSASLKPGKWWNGGPTWRAATVTHTSQGKRYLRSEEEIMRSQFIERTIWQNASLSVAGPHTILLGRGDNISIQYSSSVLLGDRIINHLADAGLYPGARVVVYANGQDFIIRHNVAGGVYAAWTTSGGSGYTTATVSFSGGGGSGAAANAVLRAGGIHYIEITSAGSGYTSAPTMTITGDGTGAVGACCREAPFLLVKGADTTIPNGRAIEFVVAPDRTLREVGDYSARL